MRQRRKQPGHDSDGPTRMGRLGSADSDGSPTRGIVGTRAQRGPAKGRSGGRLGAGAHPLGLDFGAGLPGRAGLLPVLPRRTRRRGAPSASGRGRGRAAGAGGPRARARPSRPSRRRVRRARACAATRNSGTPARDGARTPPLMAFKFCSGSDRCTTIFGGDRSKMTGQIFDHLTARGLLRVDRPPRLPPQACVLAAV